MIFREHICFGTAESGMKSGTSISWWPSISWWLRNDSCLIMFPLYREHRLSFHLRNGNPSFLEGYETIAVLAYDLRWWQLSKYKAIINWALSIAPCFGCGMRFCESLNKSHSWNNFEFQSTITLRYSVLSSFIRILSDFFSCSQSPFPQFWISNFSYQLIFENVCWRRRCSH